MGRRKSSTPRINDPKTVRILKMARFDQKCREATRQSVLTFVTHVPNVTSNNSSHALRVNFVFRKFTAMKRRNDRSDHSIRSSIDENKMHKYRELMCIRPNRRMVL